MLALDGVWKGYPRWGGQPRTLRGIVAGRVPVGLRGRSAQRWALADVCFAVEPGEVLGLVGANGAGKSTTLRLAAGLTRPTRGTITRPDDTLSVLSLGDAFDPMLTGSENGLTALMLAGVRRREAVRLLPGALAFAELEAFAEAPLRTYSEGMKLRLAFSVVAQLEPRLLLLDEVIAVGDIAFQARCLERIEELRSGGAAVLVASHDLGWTRERCSRAVWLDGGRARAEGEAGAVIDAYKDAMRAASLERTPVGAALPGAADDGAPARLGSQEATVEDVVLRDGAGRATDVVGTGEALEVTFLARPAAPGLRPIAGVTLRRARDGLVLFDASTEADSVPLGTLDAPRRVALRIERLELAAGDYTLDVGLYEAGWAYAYDFHAAAYPLRVTGRRGQDGVLLPEHGWRLGAA